jgi:hypothetical protein
MSMKTNLGLAGVVVAVLVAGVAFWELREDSHPGVPASSAVAPPVTPQPSASPRPAASEAPQRQATAAPSPPAPAASASPEAPQGAAASPAGIAQSNQPPPSPSPAPSPSATLEPPGPTALAPPAPRATLPAEGEMSEADRRKVQQILQGMKFYQGPIDGQFGPMTRAAIRRYQNSIGAQSTGELTANEAARLASTH